MTIESRIAAARKELAAVHSELATLLAADKSRRRGPIVRQMHELRLILDQNYAYTSQAGQDAVIDRIFGLKTKGTFVDIGGYDGITGSNTLFLEQHRGWTGVLVEPVTAQLEKAQIARKCPCVQFAVADKAGTATFIEVAEGFTQMSGLAETYDQDLLSRVRRDPRHVERQVTVKTQTLAGILLDAGIPNPDFVSLDIEGGEVAALKAFPFADHRVGAWAIENNTGTGAINEIMRANGYQLVEFCGPDEIYALSSILNRGRSAPS